jgi:uncharacterized protein YijF (DUF1287 family)
MHRVIVATLVLGCATASAEPLGVPDRGIFSDLDPGVSLPLPAVDRAHVETVVDPRHAVVVLWAGGAPVKVYPTGGPALLPLGEGVTVALRPADAAELAPIAVGRPTRVLGPKDPVPGGDRDDDGIPDALDVLIGARKVALNGAAYTSGYLDIPFPGGDVPRTIGVCTDVVVRAMRNAGIDLQKELYDDIGRAPHAYPMVKKRNPNIDQRRVGTILPWFVRHAEKHGTDPASVDDPFRPGDILFLDTFPNRDGPEHMGIVSDRLGPDGRPLVINNWTDGYRESEMDLLGFVPVTARFRIRAP